MEGSGRIQTGLHLGLVVVKILCLLIIRIFYKLQLHAVTSHHLSVIFPHQVGASPYAGLSWEGLVVKCVGSFMYHVM